MGTDEKGADSLAQHHAHLPHRAVVDDGYVPASVIDAIHLDADDAAIHASWIFDHNPVSERPCLKTIS